MFLSQQQGITLVCKQDTLFKHQALLLFKVKTLLLFVSPPLYLTTAPTQPQAAWNPIWSYVEHPQSPTPTELNNDGRWC